MIPAAYFRDGDRFYKLRYDWNVLRTGTDSLEAFFGMPD
jgi:hypothetical protein